MSAAFKSLPLDQTAALLARQSVFLRQPSKFRCRVLILADQFSSGALTPAISLAPIQSPVPTTLGADTGCLYATLSDDMPACFSPFSKFGGVQLDAGGHWLCQVRRSAWEVSRGDLEL